MSRQITFSIPYRHSGTEHMVQGVARNGIGYAFLVPHDTTTSVAVMRRLLPSDSGIVKEFAKRVYTPRAESTARREALYHAALLRLGFGNRGTIGWRHAHDRAVARRLHDSHPAAFVTMTGSAPRSLRAAVRLEIPSFVNVNSHIGDTLAGFDGEIRRADSDQEREEIQFEHVPARRPREKLEESRLADFLMAQSRRIYGWLEEQGVPSDRLIYLPNGVDPQRFVPVERDGGARPIRAVYVGHIGYRKGLKWVAEAATRPGVSLDRLTVVGYMFGRANTLRQKLLDAGAVLTGEVPHAEVVRHYQEADVFVFPSHAEGMVRVVLEAMACGLPVIVTPNTGYEGVITDGVEGFFVPPFDADAIAAKLTLLANDGDLRLRMGRAARALAEQYSWTRFEDTFVRELTARVPGLLPGS